MTTTDKLIYLAGPYSFNPKKAFVRHMAYAAALMNKGLFVFSPILHNHQLAHTHKLPTDSEFWKTHNKQMILRCDELWVMIEPGWWQSKGTQYEISIAVEAGKLVTYVMLDGDSFYVFSSPACTHY